MNSLRAATQGIRSLSLSLARDRAYSDNTGDIQANHCAGVSLLGLETGERSQSALPSAPKDSLFVSEDESDNNDDGQTAEVDASYIDGASEDDEDGEDIEWTTDLVAWVNSLAVPARDLHRPLDVNIPTPCPGLIKEAKDHQNRALGLIERAGKSPARTLLIGDPPGLGKTLPAMMAIAKAKPTAKRFSIVVAPASCLDQWATEFTAFFKPGTVKVLVLRDPSIPPTSLLQYDVLICSYHFVMTRYLQKVRYVKGIADYKSSGVGKIPERPNLSIFSEIFDLDTGTLSPILVLDEVNAVKNHRSKTFTATLALRQLAHTCVMLTGSPIDNLWSDIYALFQFVQGHELRSKTALMRLVAQRSENHPGKYKHPCGTGFAMLIQILSYFVVRRPESTVNLPPLTQKLFKFQLSSNEAGESNDKFDTYETAIRIAASESGKKQRDGTAFKSLTHALQHACHPQLVELMKFIRSEGRHDQADEDEDVLHDAEAIEHWTQWRDNLKTDGAWRSSRIDAIIDVFNEHRDLDPSCSVVIFDESVYFLDIVQIALESMYEPVPCVRYDGRLAPEKRGDVLQEFKDSNGSKILLMSRAAGGVGLNIPFANIVIQCSPWWKTEWELQAYKRVWRPGQTREVTYIVLQATGCRAEEYKAKARNKKHVFNMKVLKAITRLDHEEPDLSDKFL